MSSRIDKKLARDVLESHNLAQSMSRRVNCHDNAVAESFFQLLKGERVRRKVYATRDEARQNIVDYIDTFYNLEERHLFNARLSPVESEKRHFLRLQGIQENGGGSDYAAGESCSPVYNGFGGGINP